MTRMDFGIDTLRSRLDLVSWSAFRTWNGGQLSGSVVTGGKPAFAGRHFLGAGLDASGTTRTGFLWGHGEATDCMTNSSPESLAQLNTLTDAIAPMQAAFPNRQLVTGAVGHVYGAIDANAICDRLSKALLAGEFALPASGRVLVWLNVAPGVALSQDYWAGWADKVNTFAFFGFVSGDLSAYQPFRAGVQCRFQSVSGKLRPDAQVAAALAGARTAWRGTNAICHGCWADSPTAATADWVSFAGGPTPLIWRTTHGFNGSAFDSTVFDVDVTNPGPPVANAIDFMLVTQKWQPNVPGIVNFGVSVDDLVTQADITAVQAHDIPQMHDSRGHYAQLPADPDNAKVKAIGRYMKPSITPAKKPTRAEAEMISQAGLDYWTISEDLVAVPSRQNLDYYNQTTLLTTPTLNGQQVSSGTYDGYTAFHYCGDVLHQPPHTPVFFAIDNVDPADSTDQGAVGITSAEAEKRIKDYITKIKEERDKYATAHPERPYQIGLYTSGTTSSWCYEQGIVDMFWQPLSSGRPGNAPPNWPWYHANRWQWNQETALVAAGWTVPGGREVLDGADPDADWGDGGTWNFRDPLLTVQDTALLNDLLQSFRPFGRFEALVTPAAQ